ncbi:MAG: hypothetical protein JST09_14630 [Bacteroidetes bacterium]|nr:hypothetical protein [Bacteroidota bacterium]
MAFFSRMAAYQLTWLLWRKHDWKFKCGHFQTYFTLPMDIFSLTPGACEMLMEMLKR